MSLVLNPRRSWLGRFGFAACRAARSTSHIYLAELPLLKHSITSNPKPETLTHFEGGVPVHEANQVDLREVARRFS